MQDEHVACCTISQASCTFKHLFLFSTFAGWNGGLGTWCSVNTIDSLLGSDSCDA